MTPHCIQTTNTLCSAIPAKVTELSALDQRHGIGVFECMLLHVGIWIYLLPIFNVLKYFRAQPTIFLRWSMSYSFIVGHL